MTIETFNNFCYVTLVKQEIIVDELMFTTVRIIWRITQSVAYYLKHSQGDSFIPFSLIKNLNVQMVSRPLLIFTSEFKCLKHRQSQRCKLQLSSFRGQFC